jgi:cyclopropane-fatty-acyl-phospholipid synthase
MTHPPMRLPAAARAMLAMLQRMPQGQLALHLPGARQAMRLGDDMDEHASLRVHDLAVFSQTLRRGDIGFAESYIAGQWDSPQLADLLTLLARNHHALAQAIYGSRLGGWLYRLRHALRRNTRHNSRKNIHAHYDLGNAFYQLWLDETMTYSSAWFEEPEATLAQAQGSKIARALHAAQVQPGSRVLEIGCGWGALAEQAAAEQGAHVTGITLSTEQLAYAQQRLQRAGLAAHTELRLQDYRDTAAQHAAGSFDAVLSIEMIEAVGQAYWPTYFDAIAHLLKPGGLACVQVIVIDDALFDRYLKETDFIQQYIFPGGCLLSRTEVARQAQRAGLTVEDSFAFGADYARTLAQWAQRVTAQEPAIRALGFDTRFMRTWLFYLAYCEAGFRAGTTDVLQVTLRKP